MKSVSEKKSRGHRTSKIIKSKQSCSNGYLPCHCSILALSARAQCMTWHGVACGFACALRMRRNNYASVLKMQRKDEVIVKARVQ